MAKRTTGRSRTAELKLTGHVLFRSTRTPFVSDIKTAQNFPTAWLCRVLGGIEVQGTPTYLGGGMYQDTWRMRVTLNHQFDTHNFDRVFLSATSFVSPPYPGSIFPPPGIIGGNFFPTASDLDLETDATLTLVEEIETTTGGDLLDLQRTLVQEKVTAYALSTQAAASITTPVGRDGFGGYSMTVSFNETFSFNDSGTAAKVLGPGLSDYLITFAPTGFNNAGIGGVRGSVRIDCPGIQHTVDELSVAADGQTRLYNNPSDPLQIICDSQTTRPSSSPSIGWQLGPDWAVTAHLNNYQYWDGGDYGAVNVYHRHDRTNPPYGVATAQVVGSGASPDYRFPAVGYHHYLTGGYAGGSPGAPVSPNRNLFSAIPGGLGFNLPLVNFILVDEAWADAAGTLPSSTHFRGNNKFYQWNVTAPFTAARLKLDSTHRFTHFDATTGWTGTPPPTLTGGFLRFVATAGQIALSGRRLCHFGYRYARLRVRATTAGARFTLRLKTRPDVTPKAEWYLTVPEANTWVDLLVDLARPQNTLALAHPGRFQGFLFNLDRSNVGAALSLEFTDASTFEFDYLEGYHRPEAGPENRTPARLLAPLSCQPIQTTDQDDPAFMEQGLLEMDGVQEDGVPSIYTGAAVGGSLWGRLVVNGVLGLDFRTSSAAGDPEPGWGSAVGSVNGAWDYYKYKFDDVACDTGIHVDPQANSLGDEAFHLNGYSLLGAPLWEEFALDTWLDVRAVRRSPTWFGYYGSGDFVNQSYGVNLVFYGDKVWGGEVLGNIGKTGISVLPKLLYTVNRANLAPWASGTPDADGFYRVPAPYGVPKTYSSLPVPPPLGTGSAITRKQFTLVGSTYTYTAQGEKLNNHFLLGSGVRPVDGSSVVLVATAGARRPIVVLDRYPSWYDVTGKPGHNPPWLLRDYTWQLFLFHTDGDGHLIVERYEHDDSAVRDLVTIDSDPECGQPTFDLVGNWLEGVYLRGTAPYLARSYDHGAQWTLTTIPGTYDSLTAANYRKRKVVLGFRSDAWHVRVGQLQTDNTYTWSGEQLLALTDADGRGTLRLREDGFLEFTWADTSDVYHVTRCRVLSLLATGTWA